MMQAQDDAFAVIAVLVGEVIGKNAPPQTISPAASRRARYVSRRGTTRLAMRICTASPA